MSENSQKGEVSKWKKELRFWGIFAAIALFLYMMGWHTSVLGTLQRGVLQTGVIKPSLPSDITNLPPASRELYFVDEDHRMTSLHDFEGKVLFINMWATWCPPCIAEMPSIHNLYKEFRNDDRVQFLLISLDENFDDAKEFMDRRDFELPVYHFRNRAPDAFNSTAIPTTYVITPNNRLALEKKGLAKYDTDEFYEFLRQLAGHTPVGL